MAECADARHALPTVARVLMWCVLLSGAILLLWFCMLAFAGEWVYRMHSQFIPVSREHFAFVHYGDWHSSRVPCSCSFSSLTWRSASCSGETGADRRTSGCTAICRRNGSRAPPVPGGPPVRVARWRGRTPPLGKTGRRGY